MRVSGWRALAPVLALGVGLAARPAAAQDVTFTTGPQGGLWAPLGAALRDIWQSSVPGLTVPAFLNMSAPRCARLAIRGFDRGRAMVVTGFFHKLGLWLGALAPGCVKRFVFGLAARKVRAATP